MLTMLQTAFGFIFYREIFQQTNLQSDFQNGSFSGRAFSLKPNFECEVQMVEL